MKVMSVWQGTSVHIDPTKKSHLALNTNPNAYFIFPKNPIEQTATEAINIPGEIIHIPADGYVYTVDTTKPHMFVNAGEGSRTHLIMSHRP